MPIFLLLATILCLESGRRLRSKYPVGEAGVLESCLFALLGLLLALTFNGAADRFERRRALIVEEANCIGSAYLRIDLLPKTAQPALRKQFLAYVDARIEFYRQVAVGGNSEAVWQQIGRLQGELWTGLIGAVAEQRDPVTAATIPAFNEMFDIAATRKAAFQMHPPAIIYGLLVGVSLICSALAGYSIGQHSRLHNLCFALVLAVTFFVIVDLEHPRQGWIRIDSYDQILVDARDGIRQSMTLPPTP